jgi:type IV pilus assembly protein PilB
VGKFDIDTLLDELGAQRQKAAPPVSAPPAPSDTAQGQGQPERSAAEPGPNETIRPEESVRLSETLSATLSATMSGTLSQSPKKPARAASESEAWDHAGTLKRLLVESGVASAKQVSASETIIRQSPGASLLELLLDQGVDELRLFEVVATALRMPLRRLTASPDGTRPFDERLLNRLGAEFCKQAHALPLGVEDERIVLGMARPDDVFTPDEVRLKLGARSLKLVVITPSDLRACLESLGEAEGEDVNIEEILGDIEEDDVRVEAKQSDEVDLEREAAGSPVIRYVNHIIQTAVKEGASDIHIEPGDKVLKVRFRIDGELFEMMQPPAKMAAAMTSRLKIMANLDIAERRLPQDGRIRCTVQGRKLDLRMSTLPTAVGEKTVLRILDTRSINVSLDDLGFDENTLTIWKNLVEMPHGIVLVTGPTGSGKTTTLYASLRQMDKKTQNVSTVEDPIEYHLDGITQTQTHEKIGMTFAKALKALLRQDPDVIMLGEIRDQETALTAVQAALTGHLVLSTLHTNDAPSSITRLVNIGIEPFLLGAAVNGCLAQRLVRRICQHCRRPATLSAEMTEFLELQGMVASALYEGAGCERCRSTGHQGRLGIYELLALDDNIRDVIARNPNVTEFRRMCVQRGMVTLRQDGLVKVSKGLTTVQEVLRATEASV